MLMCNVFILYTAVVTWTLHATIQIFKKDAVKIFDSILLKGISEKPVHMYVSVGSKSWRSYIF